MFACIFAFVILDVSNQTYKTREQWHRIILIENERERSMAHMFIHLYWQWELPMQQQQHQKKRIENKTVESSTHTQIRKKKSWELRLCLSCGLSTPFVFRTRSVKTVLELFQKVSEFPLFFLSFALTHSSLALVLHQIDNLQRSQWCLCV